MLSRISRTALRTVNAASRSVWFQHQPILRSALVAGSCATRPATRAQSSMAEAEEDVSALELEHALANEIEFEEVCNGCGGYALFRIKIASRFSVNIPPRGAFRACLGVCVDTPRNCAPLPCWMHGFPLDVREE